MQENINYVNEYNINFDIFQELIYAYAPKYAGVILNSWLIFITKMIIIIKINFKLYNK